MPATPRQSASELKMILFSDIDLFFLSFGPLVAVVSYLINRRCGSAANLRSEIEN